MANIINFETYQKGDHSSDASMIGSHVSSCASIEGSCLSSDTSVKGNCISYDEKGDRFSSSVNSHPSVMLNGSNIIRRVSPDLIAPALTDVTVELADEHAADPIKSLDEIERISKHLIGKGRYRDNMFFIVGINLGLRISDLLTLRFCYLINDDLTFKSSFPILEKKTKNTRKVKKNRHLTINDAVVDAVLLYLNNTKTPCSLDDYMFRSESNNCNSDKPINRRSANSIMYRIKEECGLNYNVSTHTLRKTFGYHQMVMSNNDPRKLLVLQKMFGHSSSMQTLEYIGITGEEIEDAYRNLNLGNPNHYITETRMLESAGA